MNKKPGIVLVGMALQTGISLLFVGTAGFFLFLMSTVKNSGGSSLGFKLSLVMLLPLTLAAVVGLWGMWKSRPWGWWMGLAVNTLALLTMIPDLIQHDPAPDVQDVAGAVIFVLGVAFFLPRSVRHYFLRPQ